MSLPGPAGLYDPRDEHDACGVGFVVDIQGRRSHGVIEQGLQILLNLLHRGACGCEANTGDGAGILIQMPDRFLRKATAALGFSLPPAGHYGAGLVFLPTNQAARERLRQLIEETVRAEGHAVLGWRVVPGDDSTLGASARATKPVIEQLFVEDRQRSGSESEAAARQRFERALYVIRKHVEHAVDRLAVPEAGSFYIVSLSANTLIYKGMLTADQIAPTFPDLTDPDMESALALVHQRFSTNTFPSWPLAHPYRYVAHNGEINTLRGNVNWMHAREGLLKSAVFGDDLKKILPVIREGGSDTATFDNVLELLVMSGRSLPHADPDDDSRAVVEPRDDDARGQGVLRVPLVADGAVGRPGVDRFHRRLGDRRGARSQRPSAVALLRHHRRPRRDGVRGRRARHSGGKHPDEGAASIPAGIFLVDTVQGRIVSDEEVKRELAAAQPYGQWLADHLVDIEELPVAPHLPPLSHETDPAAPAAVRLHPGGSAASCSRRWPPAATSRSVRWAPTRRWRCCRIGRACSTTTSSSSSRRSPIRRSTRSAKSS